MTQGRAARPTTGTTVTTSRSVGGSLMETREGLNPDLSVENAMNNYRQI
jgi:hypothetical protein